MRVLAREGKDAFEILRLLADSTNTPPAATVVAAHVGIARIKVQAPPADRIICEERTRPIVAAAARIVERTVEAKPGSGQENGIAIRICHFAAVHTVQGCPFPCTLRPKFHKFIMSRHTPCAPPINMGCIIFGVKHALVVKRAVTAIIAVLGQRIIRTFAPVVGTPVVGALCRGFAPSEIVSIIFRRVCADIHGCPLDGKPEIYPYVTILRTRGFPDSYITTGFHTTTVIRSTGNSCGAFAYCFNCAISRNCGNATVTA